MRRESRQHGMVKTYPTPRNEQMRRESRQKTYPTRRNERPKSKSIINGPPTAGPTPRNEQPKSKSIINGPPTAGPFTKVATKPTNHSKFTGRPMWRDGHVTPASKVKGGNQFRWSSDADSDYRLMRLSGSSATNVMDHLDWVEWDEDEEY